MMFALSVSSFRCLECSLINCMYISKSHVTFLRDITLICACVTHTFLPSTWHYCLGPLS